jgi:hypothetical protein
MTEWISPISEHQRHPTVQRPKQVQHLVVLRRLVNQR